MYLPPRSRICLPILFVDTGQSSNDNIAGAGPKSTNDSQRPSSQLVDDNEADSNSDELKDIKDTRQDEGHLIRLSNGAEKRRCVVDEGVDTRELLEEADPASDSCSAQHLPVEQVEPREDLQLEAASSRMFLLEHHLVEPNLSNDALVLLLHAGIRGRQTPQLAQTRKTFLVAADESQPSWRVWEELNPNAEDCRANHLQSEGKSERDFASDILGAVGDPERNDNT